MAKQQLSIVADFVEKGILKENGETIELSSNDLEFLQSLAQKTNDETTWQYSLIIPESFSLVLRLIIVDTLYLAVQGKIHHVYFVTDHTGGTFLRRTLQDLHTDDSHLTTILLWYLAHKITIVSGHMRKPLASNEVAIYFRDRELASDRPSDGSKIALFTLRDIFQVDDSFAEQIEALQKRGWTNIVYEPSDSSNTRGLQVLIEELHDNDISPMLVDLAAARVEHTTLRDHINSFVCFYSTVPVPLKRYNISEKILEVDATAISSLVPSKYVQALHLRPSHHLLLESLCSEVEKKLYTQNPKYSRLLDHIIMAQSAMERVAIVLPNKLMAEALTYCIEKDLGTEYDQNNLKVLYPEKMFAESLFSTDRFGSVIFSFSPPTELVFASCALARKLVFIQYPHEAELLQDMLSEAQKDYSRVLGFTPNEQLLITRQDVTQKTHKGTREPTEAIVDRSDYARFLSYLERSDPTDEYYTYDGFVDTNDYVLSAEDDEWFEVHGWENIILFREQEVFHYAKYRWIFPRDIVKGDVVIIVPLELKEAFFYHEISGDLSTKGHELDTLLGLVAEWKKALIQISSRDSLVEIYNRLTDQGVNKGYQAIQNWFSGLTPDPKESVIFAILNSEINIGPRDEIDIKMVGDAFRITALSEKHKEIHAAMKLFRANNSSSGRIARSRLLAQIEEPEIAPMCTKLRVSKIDLRHN